MQAGDLRITGRADYEYDVPLATVLITVRELKGPESHTEGYLALMRTTTTDSSGAFSMSLGRQGQFAVWATHHLGSSEVAYVALSSEEPEAKVEFLLFEYRAIEGIVLGKDMKPVRGAEVTAYVDVEQLGVELPLVTTSAELYGQARVRTEADGSFRLYPVRAHGLPFIVQATQQVQGSEERRSAAGVSIVRATHTWSAQQSGVHAGKQGLSLLLLPPIPGAGSLQLKLVSEDGGSLPDWVRCKARQLGPGGGSYTESSFYEKLDEQGVLELEGIKTGARYEFALSWSGLAGGVLMGPVEVTTPGQVVPVSVPGLHYATIHLEQSGREVEAAFTVSVVHITEAGVRRSMSRVRGLDGQSGARLQLTAGTYELQAFLEGQVSAGNSRIFASKLVTMPAAEASFTISAD